MFLFLGRFSGIAANLLSLGAPDFGIIVDGALVKVEHIVHALGGKRAGLHAAGPRPDSLFQQAYRKDV